AKQLATLCDVYVNDAFGAAHRAHASTAAITTHVAQAAAGLLMQKELEYLGRVINHPEHPFVAILGGAKVSDKIPVINALADRGATVVVGGGDSVAAITKAGVADRITHISTGGGATLEFLAGDELPGVAALNDN